MASMEKIDGETVREDFNAISAVLHYTRAAHQVGLWKSERLMIERHFPDRATRLLEAGCGAGRVSVGLWELGYRDLTGFDFAAELVDQATALAAEKQAAIRFAHADATDPGICQLLADNPFGGVLFLFNGLMQIPGRENRRTALCNLRAMTRPGARLLFTTHDRDDPADRKEWEREAARWAAGEQNPRLLEFGDRYFTDQYGNTFINLPDRAEILDDLAATGWVHLEDAMRNDLASETPRVRNFSDNCRFWAARKA